MVDLKHKSFYGFYPSEVFAIKGKEIKRLENEMRDYEGLVKLKQLYANSISSSLGEDIIIQKCEYSKAILRNSMEDINIFNTNSQRIGEQLIPIFSLIISILSLSMTYFNMTKEMIGNSLFCVAITITVGATVMYIKTTNRSTTHSKVHNSVERNPHTASAV